MNTVLLLLSLLFGISCDVQKSNVSSCLAASHQLIINYFPALLGMHLCIVIIQSLGRVLCSMLFFGNEVSAVKLYLVMFSQLNTICLRA